MNHGLTKDEFDALTQVSKGLARERPSACVSRNAKRLSGLKYVAYKKDGTLALTDKGKETLYIKKCIDGLRAVSTNPLAPLDAEVATFLGKKGHIAADAAAGGFVLTQKGRESLAAIDAEAV